MTHLVRSRDCSDSWAHLPQIAAGAGRGADSLLEIRDSVELSSLPVNVELKAAADAALDLLVGIVGVRLRDIAPPLRAGAGRRGRAQGVNEERVLETWSLSDQVLIRFCSTPAEAMESVR